MPYITPDGKANLRRRRMLWHGAPNTRKTTTLMQLPKPLAILSYPGEQGFDTIPERPEDRPGISPFNWVGNEKDTSTMILQAVEDQTMSLLTKGEYAAFAGDGLHKLFEYILDATSNGAYFEGEEYDGRRVWPRAYGRFKDYLTRVMNTSIPVIVFTCWAAPEKDRAKKAGEKDTDYAKDVPSHLYPDLPGQLAKGVMGIFSVVLYQSLRKLDPIKDKEPYATWQTRPAGDVWGAGIKAPLNIVQAIPTYMPAEYQQLARYLEGGTGG